MILAESEIRRCIEDGTIGISPDVREEQIQPASLDFRIKGQLYDVANDEMQEAHTICVEPHTPYLGTTVETVSLPNHILAQVAGRSSLGRKFVVVHKTAGVIDPGFEGEITLEIYNFGKETVELTHGDRVGQFVFKLLYGKTDGYGGQYQGQEEPTESGGL